jgi:hypothetical protein
MVAIAIFSVDPVLRGTNPIDGSSEVQKGCSLIPTITVLSA